MPKLSDEDLLKVATRNYRVAVRHQQKWKRDAKKAFRFKAGDQLGDDDKHKLEQEKRPVVAFNMIEPNVKAVKGMQTANRTEPRFAAYEGPSSLEQMFADWANSLLKKLDEECNAEMETSDAFGHSVVCGIGWTQRTISYDDDPKGVMVKRMIDPMRKWYDPSAKRHNLVDRRFDFTEIFMDKDEFEARFPDAKGKGAIVIGDIASQSGGPWSVGGEEHEMFDTEVEHEEAQDPYRGDHSSPDGYERLRDKIRVIEYNYYNLESSYQVFRDPKDEIIPEDGWGEFQKTIKSTGFTLKAVDDAEDAAELTEANVIAYKRNLRKVFYKAMWTGQYLLQHEENIDPTGFNEHCITGEYDNATGLFYGIVRSMIDPQLWSNKLFMQIMLVVMSNPKGGAFVKKGAFKDIEKAKQDYAQAAPLLEMNLKDGEVFDNVLKERMPAPYPQGLHEVMTYAAGIIPKVTGINMELLGMAQKDQPGILEHLRQQAGMTILATFFDSLRVYHKLDGKTALYLLLNEVPMKRQQEILGQENAVLAQAVSQIPKDATAFKIMVDEAPYSPNRKFLVFKMLNDLGTTNPEFQSMVGQAALDYIPLPQSVVEQIKKQLAAKSQEGQANQQQSAQMQMMQMLAEVKEMLSKSKLYDAQAVAAEAKIGREDAEAPAKMLAEVGSAMGQMGAAHASIADAKVSHAIAATGPKPKAGNPNAAQPSPLAFQPIKMPE